MDCNHRFIHVVGYPETETAEAVCSSCGEVLPYLKAHCRKNPLGLFEMSFDLPWWLEAILKVKVV